MPFTQAMLMAGGGLSGRVSITDQGIDSVDAVAPDARYELQSSGQARTYTNISGYQNISGEWKISGTGSNYEVRATVSATSDSNGEFTGTLNTWQDLGTTREWQKTNSSGAGGLQYTTLLIEIRDAATLVVLDSASIDLRPDRS